MLSYKSSALEEIDLSLMKINTFDVKKYADNRVHEKKQRSDYGMVFVLNGKATYYREHGANMVVEKDTIFFLQRGSSYQRVADPDEPFEFILASFDMVESSGETVPLPVDEVNRFESPAYYRACFYEAANIWEKKWLGYKLRCNAIFQNICYHLINDILSKDTDEALVEAKLHETIKYMEGNFHKPITIQDLADQVNLSASHFHRLFRHNYGVSPLQYLISIRIGAAKDLMNSGMYSVSEVAELVGYEDFYYFSRLFKKATGQPPSEYRRAHK